MKVLVVSDSHGFTSNLLQAVETVQPDHLLHLGDGFRDVQKITALYPLLLTTQVSGNCDFLAPYGNESTLTLDGVTLFLCHGHTRGVKSSMQNAYLAAREAGAQVLLFGHTHCAVHDNLGDLLVVNPGSIGYDGRYAVLEITDGKVTCTLCG